MVTRRAETSGPGRAFPIHSENYAIESFQQINPAIVSSDITLQIMSKFSRGVIDC